MTEKSTTLSYWEKRKSILYYQVVKIIADHLSQGANSIIDVGSAACPYLDWFDHVPNRSSIDLKKPYVAKGIKSFTGDFLKWEPDRDYDIVTCLQVLEHVPQAGDFAQKLLSIGKVVIVSVPYKWPEDHTASHVHDPVDEDKLRSWFGRTPNYQYICAELMAPLSRIIQVYDGAVGEPYATLRERDAIIRREKK